MFPKKGKILAKFLFIKIQENEQNSKTFKLNSEAKSKSVILQLGLKSPNISKKLLPEEIWSKKSHGTCFSKILHFASKYLDFSEL